jgi:aspartate/methionine/tyrosine aminotransferase
MQIKPFKLERYFAKYEFSTKYLLSSSDCDGYSMESVLNCATAEEKEMWDSITLGYTDSQGGLPLREAIVRQYQTITPEEVFVLSPGEANFILMNVMLKRGDHVVCMAPAYQSLYQVCKSIGCNISWWKPDHEEAWDYSPETLKSLITDKTKLLIVNFPHNPTGFIPTRNQLDEIIAIARARNILIFSDEMYHQLVHEPSRQIPSICDLYENSITLWGMAKSFGMAGLRLGWVATKNRELLQKMMQFKDYLSICNNPMSETLSLIALNHKEQFIEPNITKIIQNKAIFEKFAKKTEGLLQFSSPIAGSTAFVKINTPKALDYSEKLVKETGIMLVPSEMFEYGRRHLRIGFGRENMAEVLAVWEKYINK